MNIKALAIRDCLQHIKAAERRWWFFNEFQYRIQSEKFALKTRKVMKMASVSLISLTTFVGLDTVYDKNEKRVNYLSQNTD